MFNTFKKITFLVFLILSPMYAKTILFDIHGVLLYENISGAVKKKVMNKLTTAQQEKVSRGLRDAKEYKKLCALYDEYKVMADYPDIAYPADAHLPYETYALFAGHISPEELYKRTKKMIAQADIDKKFESKMELIIISSMIETVFERKQLLEAVSPLAEGHALVEHFANSNEHEVAVFSNAPQEWVDVYLTHEPFSHIFNHIKTEKILTSGGLQKLKPEAPAFAAACEILGCAPEEIILIDDTPGNVEGARTFGMQAVHFDHNEIERVIEELTTLGVCDECSAPRLQRLLQTQRSIAPEYEPFFFVS